MGSPEQYLMKVWAAHYHHSVNRIKPRKAMIELIACLSSKLG